MLGLSFFVFVFVFFLFSVASTASSCSFLRQEKEPESDENISESPKEPSLDLSLPLSGLFPSAQFLSSLRADNMRDESNEFAFQNFGKTVIGPSEAEFTPPEKIRKETKRSPKNEGSSQGRQDKKPQADENQKGGKEEALQQPDPPRDEAPLPLQSAEMSSRELMAAETVLYPGLGEVLVQIALGLVILALLGLGADLSRLFF